MLKPKPLLRTTLGALLLWSAAIAAPISFDIPAQPAPAALMAFAKQARVEIVFAAEALAAINTAELKGNHEPEQAIALLLANTGYTASRDASGKFVVTERKRTTSIRGLLLRPDGSPAADVAVRIQGTALTAKTDASGQYVFLTAQAGTQLLVAQAEGYQPLHLTDVVVRNGQETVLNAQAMRKAVDPTKLDPFVVVAEAVTELDQIDVTGTKPKPFVDGNMDIVRTINDAQPYYIFDAKTIDTSGAINVEDFLKQRLSMNTVAQTNGAVSGYNRSGNTSNINLRGVGTDKTLILVDGRRLASVAAGSGDYQPDLNGIPMNAIERIEVLPSSASGIYGGSAIGGVVNLILKRHYQGGELRMTYDNTWDTDSPRRTASISYGMGLEGGKTQLSINASWEDFEPMLVQDRQDIFQEAITGINSRSPSYLYSVTSPWVGSLPNISTSATSLVLKNGTSLNSKYTYIPTGTSGTTASTTLASGLLANAGGWKLDLPASTQAPTGLLRPFGATPKTKAMRATARRQMLPKLELFAELSYNENKTSAVYNPISTLTVPASAPTNPFTTAVYVRVPDATNIPMTTMSENRAATLGARAQLPWGWTGMLDYTWSENKFDYLYYNTDTTARAADLASGALNPFVDTLLYPINWSKYLQEVTYFGTTRNHDINLKASGALPELPWGQPNLTVGLEHRIQQRRTLYYQYAYATTVASSYSMLYYPQDSVTDSGYAEFTLPLLKQGWLPGVHALELQASGREEHYTVDTGTPYAMTYYNATPAATYYGTPTLNGQPYFSETSYDSRNYTVGLKFQPVPDVTLRVSRATAFLPPTPSQLVANPEVSTTPTTVTDPKTGQQVSVNTVSGGNANLTPQNSKSLNAGIIWEPRWKPIQGLRFNAEYSKIEQFDAISTLSAQSIVNQESVYPGRVTRDANGTITLVDITSLNLYRRETEAWDLTASYTRDTAAGTFSFSAMESILTHLKTQYSQTAPEYDAAGYSPGDSSGAPKYKSIFNLNWAWRNWNAGWTTRYFSSYKQYGAAGGPYSLQYNKGATYTYYTAAQGSDTIPSQTYHDMFVGYDFRDKKTASGRTGLAPLGTKLLSGLSVQFGVRNVFDKVPPLDVYYSGSYYLSPYGDTRLRSYWITVKKTF